MPQAAAKAKSDAKATHVSGKVRDKHELASATMMTSAHHMQQLQNKYGNCNEHHGKYCFVKEDGSHRFLTIQEMTLWAASIVSL